jgi:hypothetical protein
MRRLVPIWILAPLIAVAIGACSDDVKVKPTDGRIVGDSIKKGDGPQGKKLTWSLAVLDSDRAGKNATIGRHGKVIGLTYFRELKDEVTKTCPPGGSGNPGGPKPRPVQDLYYVQYDGAAWGKPVKVDQTVGSPYGLSFTFDKSSGKAFIGYLGGGLSTECSSSDAVIASSTDGATWTQSTVRTTGPFAGDTVGYWMAVAVDSAGQPHAAFKDTRFGYYEQDGRIRASLLYDNETVVAENGAGDYNGLLFDTKNQAVVVFYNSQLKDSSGGIQIGLRSGGWTTQQIVTGATSERIGFATDGKDLFGVSYYEPGNQLLRYIESAKDLKNWVGATVDPDLSHNGEFSSLAYDSKGNPAISYYRCGKVGGGTCDFGQDGLKFAWRINGTWTTYEVDTGGSNACGTYTSLTFAPGDVPVIAYQCVALNNTTGEFLGSLKVATGAVK